MLLRCSGAVALLAVRSLWASQQIECGCAATGGYTNPIAGVAPQVITNSSNSGTSPHGVYRVTANISGSIVNLAVTRIVGGATLVQVAIPVNAAWGFSPDDDRFVYNYSAGSVDNVILYNLAGGTPAVPVATEAVSTGSDRILFSPHGKYFFYSAITGTSHTSLQVMDARTGKLLFGTQFIFYSPPGSPGDSYGMARWGFSPDANDRSFVYARISGPNSAELSLVNLEANLTSGGSAGIIYAGTLLWVSDFWQFSLCGDVLGLVTQPNQTQINVDLLHTLDGTPLANQTFNFAGVVLSSTVSSNVAKVGGTYHLMATNAASAACPSQGGIVAAFTSPATIWQGAPAAFMDASTDAGGTIVSWLWQFGDGTSATDRNPTHTYASVGSFNVRLQVTDDNGATNAVVRAVSVRANMAPQASFTFPATIRQGIGTVFTDSSTDPDGTIVGWVWQFGDGTSATNENPTHTYSSPGTFVVSLQVADDGGATNTALREVVVQTNQPPHASFTFMPSNPQRRDIVTFTDTSTDDDGIQARSWSFGSDQATVLVKLCTTQQVTLTVYDGMGQSDAVTQTVPVSAPSTSEIFVPAGGDLPAAVASACPGDVIRLEAGAYAGGVHLRDLTLLGAGPGETIVAGGRADTAHWVVITDSGSTSNALRDLTITGGGGTNQLGRAEGGGVYAQAPTHIYNVDVSQNTGSGGIYANGNAADVELRELTVVSNQNQGRYWGGGVTIDCCGTAIIKDSEVAFNTNTNSSAAGGGVADLEAAQVILTGNYIHHNVSGGSGGGLSLGSWGNGDLIANNWFIGNTAVQGGGAFINDYVDDILFVGNLVALNTGGGVFDNESRSRLAIINSTIVDNLGPGLTTNPWPGPGKQGAAVLNSIIAGNSANLVDSTTNMTGCVTNHVYLGAASGFRGNGDYHLAAGSLAIDAGDASLYPQATNFPGLLAVDPEFPAILSQDLDGDSRIVDGDGDGVATIDLGYDEFAGPVLRLRIQRSGDHIVVAWNAPEGMLQEAPAITGPWQDVSPPPTNSYMISTPIRSAFYRLRAAMPASP